MKSIAALLLPLIVVCVLSGCRSESVDPAPALSDVLVPDDDGHDHPTEGPRGGDLIILGDDVYHAELLHEDTDGVVTVYILDGSAIQQQPISAPDVAINISGIEEPKQFKLTADPVADDPPGQSSRFTLEDAELLQHLEGGRVDAQLVVSIKGTSFRGPIEHDH